MQMNADSLLADWQEPRWYVLFVRSNQEKRVAQRLHQGGIEHFLPCYRSLRQWKDRRVTIEAPLFPGYLFVKLPLLQRMRALTVPNVVSLVGTRNVPSAISEEEMKWVRRGAEEGKAMPHPFLKVGERVAIVTGVMAGMEGILLRRQNSDWVVVSLTAIARSFAVEVDASWIKPLGGMSSIYGPLNEAAQTPYYFQGRSL